MSMILPAVKFQQRHFPMYVAAVPVSLLDGFSVDVWDPKNVRNKRGYQRRPDEKRIKKIAKFFENKNSIMPVAGLLNIREKGKVKYKQGKLIIPDGVRVWVVDMQHRLKGLIEAAEQKLIKGETFRFPVVITEGLNLVQEASQFYIINTKAKKMNVALTRRLLIENNTVKDISDAKPWELAAVRATIEINKSPKNNVWRDAILEPNQDRQTTHIATERSFVTTLRQIFITQKHASPKKIAKKVMLFWSAIERNIPDAFREPKKYLIQKTPGMYALNFFIAPAFLKKTAEKDYVRKLAGLKTLGADFWRNKNPKGAKRFGGGFAGQAALADHIKKHIR